MSGQRNGGVRLTCCELDQGELERLLEDLVGHDQ